MLNKEIAYLSGVIMGDGNLAFIERNDRIKPMVRLNIFNNSKSYLKLINNIFKKEFDLNLKLYKKKGDNCYILETYNRDICIFFSELLNIKNKKINMQVPLSVQNKKIFKYFLAGLFDTDGYYSDTFGIMMGGTQLDFLSQIGELCTEHHGIKIRGPYKNTLRQNGKEYSRCYLKTSTYTNHIFWKEIPLVHEKYEKSGPTRI